MDDKLNSNTTESKNTKIFLQELEHRLGKTDFAKFIEKFKGFYADIDEANDITLFRYKKFPIDTRNVQFRLNAIINIENYLKGVPELIIICENKKTNKVNYVWTETKFSERLE